MTGFALAIMCTLVAPSGDDAGDGMRSRSAATELALRATGMWRGYRGSAERLPGLRRHSDGYWYPEKAFAALCGKRETCVTDHTSWCRSKYWSYREHDDTYQPYQGKRRKCVSPFSKGAESAKDKVHSEHQGGK
jgi:hypothetical protein